MAAYLKERLAPAASRSATGFFPHEPVSELGKLGVFGLQVPEEYGGLGLQARSAA